MNNFDSIKSDIKIIEYSVKFLTGKIKLYEDIYSKSTIKNEIYYCRLNEYINNKDSLIYDKIKLSKYMEEYPEYFL